jgi:protein involved in polysaccharide export with SLBB domain
MKGKALLGNTMLALLGVMACAGQEQAPVARGDQAVTQQSDHPTLQERNPRYKLCRGDSFDLVFPLAPEYNQVSGQSGQSSTVNGGANSAAGGVVIQPDGYITLLGVGDIYAEGKTLPELTEAIKTAYSKILHDPMINITLRDFDRPSFTALGYVGKPGKYDLRGDTTLTQALATAGGFTTKGAKTSQVLLFRSVSEDWVEVKKINAKKILDGRDLREDVHLRPGDMIYVPGNVYGKIEEYIPKANVGGFFPIP